MQALQLLSQSSGASSIADGATTLFYLHCCAFCRVHRRTTVSPKLHANIRHASVRGGDNGDCQPTACFSAAV